MHGQKNIKSVLYVYAHPLHIALHKNINLFKPPALFTFYSITLSYYLILHRSAVNMCVVCSTVI